MIRKVARVALVLKHHGEGHGVICLPLLDRHPLVRALDIAHHIIITVIGDFGPSAYPPLLVQSIGGGGKHERLHAKVELTVGFFAVDNVETVSDSGLVVGDSEVEPLVVVRGVDV